MRIDTEKMDWDLFFIFSLSYIFASISIMLPEMQLLRLLLGLPFLFLFPGYAVISLIFPRKFKRPEEEENSSDVKSKRPISIIGSTLNRKVRPRRKLRRTERTGHNDKTTYRRDDFKKDIDEEEIKDKFSIDMTTKVVLSIILSMGIVPIIGVILSELFRWNEDLFGIHVKSIVFSIFMFNMFVSLLAFARRRITPEEERFVFNIKVPEIFDGTTMDKVITVTLIVLIIASAFGGFLIYKFNHNNENFTEFYILGPDRTISNYPDVFYINEIKDIFIGIRNHEFKSLNYTIEIYINERTNNSEDIPDLIGLELRKLTTYTWSKRMSHNDHMVEKFTFEMPDPGNTIIYFDLVIDGNIHRELILKTNVFTRDNLVRTHGREISEYISSIDGTTIDTEIHLRSNASFDFILGVLNDNNITLYANISMVIGNPNAMNRYNTSLNGNMINHTTGLYFEVPLGPYYKIELPFSLRFEEGTYELEISLSRYVDELVLTRVVVVE